MTVVSEIVLGYVCPSLGCIMATVMFAAPVNDLQNALTRGTLGNLEPFPWVMMTGNCLGWVVYGYYQRDPFLVAANLPGLVLSIWLNSGAAKLQYKEYMRQAVLWDAQPEGSVDGASVTSLDPLDNMGQLVLVPQERALLTMLTAWSIVLVWVGWFTSSDPGAIVGLVVNVNLMFFYGAPLKVMKKVIQSGDSSSIHVPTMMMTWTNTSFWILYGLVKRDLVVIVPNAIGLSLGIIQGILSCLFPRKDGEGTPSDLQPLSEDDDQLDIEPREVL